MRQPGTAYFPGTLRFEDRSSLFLDLRAGAGAIEEHLERIRLRDAKQENLHRATEEIRRHQTQQYPDGDAPHALPQNHAQHAAPIGAQPRWTAMTIAVAGR
jgi:hypothetical protein